MRLPYCSQQGAVLVCLVLLGLARGQTSSTASDELALQLAKQVNGTLPNYVYFGYGAAPNSNSITAKGGISSRPRVRPAPTPRGGFVGQTHKYASIVCL